MKFVACALLLFVAACAGQGGDEASEAAETPSMTATDTTTVADTTMPDTTADTSMVRDTAR